jgi:hypothetical protein
MHDPRRPGVTGGPVPPNDPTDDEPEALGSAVDPQGVISSEDAPSKREIPGGVISSE